MNEDILKAARINSANTTPSQGGGSVLLQARDNVRRAQQNKQAQGYLTESQQLAAKKNADYQAQQRVNQPIQYVSPEGVYKGLGESLVDAVPKVLARGGTALVSKFADRQSMSGYTDSWSEPLITAMTAMDKFEETNASIEADRKELLEKQRLGEITPEIFSMNMNVLNSRKANNVLNPKYQAELDKPFYVEPGRNTLTLTGHEARQQYKESRALKDKIAGNQVTGQDNILGSNEFFAAPVNDYQIDQQNRQIKRRQKEEGKKENGLNSLARWGEIALTNPEMVATVGAESLAYVLPYAGWGALAGEIAGAEKNMTDRFMEKEGREYLTKNEQLRMKGYTSAYALASLAGKVNLGRSIQGTGLGSRVSQGNSAINRALAKVPGGQTARHIGTDAAFEGTQEVIQTGLEEYGSGSELTADQFGQSFVLGAAAGGAFAGVGSAVGGATNKTKSLIQGTDKYKDLNATDKESMDINSDSYRPARVVENVAKQIGSIETVEQADKATQRIDLALDRTNQELSVLKANQAANAGVDIDARQAEILTELDAAENAIEAGTLSPEETKATTERMAKLYEEVQGLKTPEEYTKAIKKIEDNLADLENTHGEVSAKLSEKRAAKGWDDYIKPAKAEAEVKTKDTDFLNGFEVDSKKLDSSADTYAPGDAVTELKSKATGDITDAENEVLRSKAKTIVDQSTKDRKEFDAINKQIKDKQVEVRKAEADVQKSVDALTAGNGSQKSVDNAKARLDYFKRERDALYKARKKYNPKIVSLNNKAIKAQKDLDRTIAKQNTKRRNETARLEKSIDNDTKRLKNFESNPAKLKEAEQDQKDIQTKLSKAKDKLNLYTQSGNTVEATKAAKEVKYLEDSLAENTKVINKIKGAESGKKVSARLASNKAKLKAMTRETNGANKKKAKAEEAKKQEEAKAKAEQVKDATAKLKQITELEKEKDQLLELRGIEETDLAEQTNKAGRKIATDNIAELDTQIKAVDTKIAAIGDKKELNKLLPKAKAKPKAAPVEEEVEVTPALKNQEGGSGVFRRIQNMLMSPSNNLSQEIILKLEDIARRLKDSTVVENLLKSSSNVSQEILVGGPGYKGLTAYDGAIEIAIRKGDEAALAKELAGLAKLKESHESKAAALTEAYRLYVNSDPKPSKRQNYVVYRKKNTNEWTFRESKLLEGIKNKTALRETGSIYVEGVTLGLEKQIREEAAMITGRFDTLSELQTIDISGLDTSASKTPKKNKGITDAEKAELGHFIERDGSNVNNMNIKEMVEDKVSKTISKVVDISVNYIMREKDGKTVRSLVPALVEFHKEYLENNPGASRLDNMFEKYQTMTNGSNKYIGFGIESDSNQETRYRRAYKGRTNVSTSYGVPYEATDVVVYHHSEGYNDSVPMARARKAELDAAMAAGATIVVIPSRFSRAESLPKLTRDIEYMVSKGYGEKDANGKASGTNGIFTRIAEDTSNDAVLTADDFDVDENIEEDVNEDDLDTDDDTGQDLNDDTDEDPVVVATPVVNGDAPNPNDKYDALVSPNNHTSKEEGLYNAMTRDEWAPLVLTPLSTDVPEASGKLDVTSTVVKQADTPLNGQMDFYSKYLATKDYDAVAEFLGQDQLTKYQKRQLEAFIRLHNKVGKRVAKAIKSNSNEFKDLKSNPLYKHIFKNGNNVPENFTTAMVVGLFQFVQTNGNKAYANNEEVSIIHGIDKNSTLSYGAATKLGKMGVHRGFMFQEIGSGAVKALGLQLGQEAQTQMIQQLESSIGALAYTLVNQPVANGDTVHNPFFIEYTDSTGVVGLSHREQSTIILDGLNPYEASMYLKNLGIIEPSLIDQNSGSTETLVKLVKASKDPYWDARSNLTRVAMSSRWDKETNTSTTYYNPEILDIIAGSERPNGEKDVIDNMFKMEKGKAAPLDEAPKAFTQKKTKKSNTDVPSNTVKSLTKAGKKTWTVEASRADALIKMYDDNKEEFFRLMGVVPDVELGHLHEIVRDQRMGDNAIKRDLLEEQIAWLKSKKEDDGYSTYYHVPVVWVNQRVGYESTLFNAQTNLFARMLSSMESWKTTVDTDQDLFDAKGNPTKHGMYLIAIAENMEGASRFMDFSHLNYSEAANTVDKMQPTDYLPEFLKYIERPTVKAGIAAAQKLTDGKTLSATEYNALNVAMKEFKMDELGFGALTELAKYTKAKSSEGSSVLETSIGAKSDGVTNGPMFTQLLLGTATAAIRMMGGVIGSKNKEGILDYLQSKANGQIDLYESTGGVMRTSLDTYVNSDPVFSTLAKTKVALGRIDGEFGSRSWAKKLLTPFNYGAGLPRLRSAISASVVDKFVENFYAAHAILDPTEKREAEDNILDTLNELVTEYNDVFIHRKITEANLPAEFNKLVYLANRRKLFGELDPNEDMEVNLAKIIAHYKASKPATHGFNKKDNDVARVEWLSRQILRRDTVKPLDQLRHSDLDFTKDFPKKYQDMIRTQADLTFGHASEMAIRESQGDYMKRRDELTTLSNRAHGNYTALRNMYLEELGYDADNMTVAQEDAIDKILFNYRAAVASGQSNLNVDSNGKRQQTISSGINLEDQIRRTRLGQSVAFEKLYRSNNDRSPTVQYDYGYTYNDTGAPGVRALALMIQSMDAMVTVNAMDGFDAMNFHDANMFGLDEFTKGVREQNKNFIQGIIKYDPSREFVKAYTRPFFKMHEMYKDSSTSQATRQKIFKIMVAEAKDLDIPGLFTSAYANELSKLELALEDGIIHQYSGAGGQYKLTAKDKKLIKERIVEVNKARVDELAKFNKIIDSYTEEVGVPVRKADALYDGLKDVDSTVVNDFLKEIIGKGNTNINELTNFLTRATESTGREIVEGGALYYLNKLQDADLSKVKVKYVSRPIRTKRADVKGDAFNERDISFNRLNNTIYINKNVDKINTSALTKEMFIASLHNNMEAIRNGSEQFKDLTAEYRVLKNMANNMLSIVAANTESLTAKEVEVLNSYFADDRNSGSVEHLMEAVLFGSNPVQSALSKIKSNYELKEPTIGARIKDFIVRAVFRVKKASDVDGNLQAFLFDTAKGLLDGNPGYDGLVEKRSSSTISKMLNDSYKTHKNAFSRETTDTRLNNYDTRFQLELYKLGKKHKGKPIPAMEVLNLVEATLKAVEETDKSKTEIGSLQADYETTLEPVVATLKASLSKGNKVVIVNSMEDLLLTGITEAELEAGGVLSNVSRGRSFYYEGNTYLISSNASANPNTRLSTVLHELVHAMTTSAINKEGSVYKKALTDLMADMTKQLTPAQRKDDDIIYALSHPDELVAQTKTRNVVRAMLLGNEVNRKKYYSTLGKALGAKDATTINALEVFDTLFSQLENEVQQNLERDTIPDMPAPFTDETIGIKTGLEQLGLLDSRGSIARNLTTFNGSLVDLAIQKFPDLKAAILNKAPVEIREDVEAYIENTEDFSLQVQAVEDLGPKVKNKTSRAAKVSKHVNDGQLDLLFSAIDNQNNYNKSVDILFSASQSSGHVDPAERFEPRAIFEFLKQPNGRDNTYLNAVVEDVVNPLMDQIPDNLVSGYDYQKVWHDAIVSGEAVYSTEAHNAGYDLDDQQSYVLEVLEVALANSIDDSVNTAVYRQLEKAYKQAKANVKAEDFYDGDWINATQEEIDIAQAKFSHIFRPPNTGGKSNYLTRFTAMTLVSPELQSVLEFSVDRVSTDKPLNERVTDAFTKIIEYFEGQAANVYQSDNVNSRVRGLGVQLADIYYKNQDKSKDNERDAFGKVDDFVSDMSQKTLDALHAGAVKVTHVPGFKETTLARVTKRLLTEQYEDFDKFVNTAMDYSRANKPLGEFGEVFNELVGTLDNPEHGAAKDLFYLSKAIEQERGGIIEDLGKAIIESYAEDNQDLSMEQNKAITSTVLRTDLQSLIGTMQFSEVMDLFKKPAELTKKIKDLETKLATEKHGKEYLIRTKALGHYMVHRKATNNMLAKNAYAIAERAGMGSQNRDKSYSTDAVNTIDQLASLYALRDTKRKDKDLVIDLYESELSNNKASVTGLEYTLLSHKDFASESKGLFEENPYSETKGYMPSMTNPIKGFAVVDESEVSLYESMGYAKAAPLDKSALDEVKGNKVLMTTSNTGKQRYVSGTISIEDTVKSGTEIFSYGDSYLDEAAAKAIKEMNNHVKNPNYEINPNKAHLVPSYDQQGEILSYSYEMSGVGLDTYLERNNNPSTLLSQLKGANLNKKAYPSHNKRVIDYLINGFREATVDDRRKFVEVGPEVSEKKGRELWHSLPKETQLYIIDQQGVASINVRNDEMNLLFGYRKYNLGSIFDKNKLDRNLVESVYAALFSGVFGAKAQLRSNQVVSFWMEAIKTLKDFIVIRNIKVMVANVLSNVSLTMVNDADPKNMLKDIKDAATYSIRYQKDKQDLNTLKHELKIGLSTPEKVSRYAELKDAIARNPLADFIEAGMMPMIVNDMSFKRGEVEFSTSFSKLADNTTGRLPSPLKTGLDYLLVSPGTPHYKFLANATQQSDFVFKYALYKQEMRKGAESKDALALARQVFIEYDVPTSKGMQFVNDVGIWMFTKFTLRIMRVLVHFVKTRANKLLIENAAMSYLFNNPSLLSLNFLGQLWGGRNPFGFPLKDVMTMYENTFPVQMIKSAL
jgi:hypothetical protein